MAGAVALALANNGVNISLCGRQRDLLEMSEVKVKKVGGKVISMVSELDTLEAAEAVVIQTKSAFGGVDIVILISPFWSGGMIHNHSLKTWDLVMNANLREPFLMARATLPILREQKHGEIMAIGSDSSMGIYPPGWRLWRCHTCPDHPDGVDKSREHELRYSDSCPCTWRGIDQRYGFRRQTCIDSISHC